MVKNFEMSSFGALCWLHELCQEILTLSCACFGPIHPCNLNIHIVHLTKVFEYDAVLGRDLNLLPNL